MKINKKYRNILVGFSVIICYLSSCIPAMDSVTLVSFKNCTNDTLFIGISDYDNIDSIWFRYIYHVDIKSKAPLLASIDSILRNNNSNINMTIYDNGSNNNRLYQKDVSTRRNKVWQSLQSGGL